MASWRKPRAVSQESILRDAFFSSAAIVSASIASCEALVSLAMRPRVADALRLRNHKGEFSPARIVYPPVVNMGVKMELQFDSTRNFEEDMEALATSERRRVTVSINSCAAAGDIPLALPFQPHPIALPGQLESSLYVLKATTRRSVILAIDEDPVFARKVVTLFRVVCNEEAERAYAAVAATLYQELPPARATHG